MSFPEYYAKQRNEGKAHRVAYSHVTKKLIRIIFIFEKIDMDFDVSKIR